MAEFVVNNKVHTTTKDLSFIANYSRELRMGTDIRKKGKVEKATEFVERMRKVQEEAETALKKAQKDMKRQVDRERKESEEWKKRNQVMYSTKNLVFKERLVKKLVDRYIGPYIIEEIVSTNTVKLQLPILMRIHLVVNISQIVWYREQVEG